jgi:hypothetical protein
VTPGSRSRHHVREQFYTRRGPEQARQAAPRVPLFPHATGRRAKKIRGKLHDFGPWSDPDGALTKYREQKEALHAGRKPRPESEGMTVKDLVNDFLYAKEALVDAGELTQRTWDDDKQVGDLVVAHLGGPAGGRRGPGRLRRAAQEGGEFANTPTGAPSPPTAGRPSA